jgi:Na+:H+ antiporter, NhaA family
MGHAIRQFFKSDLAAGVLLISAALLAIIIANTPLSPLYNFLIELPMVVGAGDFEIRKPLLLWINDGLMAVFFFMVGLELKRELIEGELSKKGAIKLPLAGTIGGMLVPALIFVALNLGERGALEGWAIPAATDIAFALGILSILGNRVPVSLKVFLVSLAVLDDIGAIIIIAIFYSDNLSSTALIVAGSCIAILAVLNYLQVNLVSIYIFVGLIMWTAVLKSGVHATLAGVVLALFIPLKNKDNPKHSPLKHLEHELHNSVNLIILPIFAFANSGLRLVGMEAEQLLHPVPVGIALGLFIGKQVGIFSVCWLMIKLKWAELPDKVNMGALYGTSVLCGIGFTMSLFIGSLAFENAEVKLFDERLGIIVGSLLSAFLGVFVLQKSLK